MGSNEEEEKADDEKKVTEEKEETVESKEKTEIVPTEEKPVNVPVEESKEEKVEEGSGSGDEPKIVEGETKGGKKKAAEGVSNVFKITIIVCVVFLLTGLVITGIIVKKRLHRDEYTAGREEKGLKIDLDGEKGNSHEKITSVDNVA